MYNMYYTWIVYLKPWELLKETVEYSENIINGSHQFPLNFML